MIYGFLIKNSIVKYFLKNYICRNLAQVLVFRKALITFKFLQNELFSEQPDTGI